MRGRAYRIYTILLTVLFLGKRTVRLKESPLKAWISFEHFLTLTILCPPVADSKRLVVESAAKSQPI